MSRDQIEDWLERGITAFKEGESALARDLLLAVVEKDEKNESAWLWLSEVVESPEDKEICLRNVLVLNPENQLAQQRIGRFTSQHEISQGGEKHSSYTIEIEPVSPAAAILYPERLSREYDFSDSIEITQVESVGLKNHSKYDDVWERNYPICSYCAGEITLDARRCPTCKRKLYTSEFLYSRPSPDLYLFVTFLLGLFAFAGLAMMFNLILRNSLTDMVWNALLLPILLILVFGVLTRQFWAYSASIIVLLLTLAIMVLNLLFGPDSDDVVQQVLSDGLITTLSERPAFYALAPLEQFVFPVQLVAVILALIYALFRVGPDFDRKRTHLEARVDRGLSDSSQYYFSGKNYAQLGMWARATLHFRRAVALEPASISYQKALAESYDQLGYYQRSLDVLEFAHRSTANPESQASLMDMMAQVRNKVEREELDISKENISSKK
jgi:tetratricopeptide (TPR) repeat protein